MASGKKNYFRHSTTAFEDPKIQKAISLLGYEGYAFFFILIEILAKQCEEEFKNPITIHQQTLRIVWRKSQQSCNKVVTKLQQSGLFLVTFKESFYEFDIPNLAKYLGRYDSKFDPNTPNKRKEKKRKEKETKEKENAELVGGEVDEVIQSWNDAAISAKFRPCPLAIGGTVLDLCKTIKPKLQASSMNWKDYFTYLASSDFIKQKKGGPVTILWALDEKNFTKVMAGSFDKKTKHDPLAEFFSSQGFKPSEG